MHTPRLAHFVWPPTPLQGVTPVDRRSRVHGVLGTGLAMFLFNVLIHGHGPLFAGMVTNLVPVGALLWGWSDGEKVTMTQVKALVGLLLMVTLVQYDAAHRPTLPRDEDDQVLAA